MSRIMSKNQTLAVKNMSDIVLARMRVRQLARMAGLGIREQACIALATSSLAQALRLGGMGEDSIEIHCSDSRGLASVRVVCTATDGDKCDLASKAIADARWMVDEMTVETLPQNNVQVTLVKRAT